MHAIPSFARGFARCAAESQAPEQWEKLDHLWVPALGPTAAAVLDYGPKRHNLEIRLGSGALWSQSRYAAVNMVASRFIVGAAATCNYNALQFTIELLVYLTGAQTSYLYLKGTNNLNGYYCYVNTNGAINLQTNQASAAQVTVWSAGAYTFDTWQHLVFSVGSASPALYINGIARSKSTTGTHIAPVASDVLFCIGNTSSTIVGGVAKCATYARALTQAESVALARDPFKLMRAA